jgi:hypothetical protein
MSNHHGATAKSPRPHDSHVTRQKRLAHFERCFGAAAPNCLPEKVMGECLKAFFFSFLPLNNLLGNHQAALAPCQLPPKAIAQPPFAVIIDWHVQTTVSYVFVRQALRFQMPSLAREFVPLWGRFVPASKL